MDVQAVATAAGRAVTAVRAGAGPCFLELRTYRFRAHSMYDPDRYRDRAEIARWKEQDPVERWRDLVLADGDLDEDGWSEIVAGVDEEIEQAVAEAEAAPLEPVEELTRFVYAEPS
jgi:pyruvate dehydrogenase E1 component alpha subunit